MDENRFIEVLAKKQSGALTLPEQKELQELLQNSPKHAQLESLITGVMAAPLQVGSMNASTHLINIQNRIKGQSPKKVLRGKGVQLRWLVAASLLALVLVTTFYWYNHRAGEAQSNVIVTKRASRTNLVLPDGTVVWVNSDTKISYDASFGKHTRDVYLVGEAYFEVINDKNKPFIVHTNSMDVRVLGTTFNVKDYETDPLAEALLISGSLEVIVREKGRNKKVLLSPNEKIITSKSPGHSDPVASPKNKERINGFSLEKIEEETDKENIKEIGWMQNKLVFKNEKIDDIVPILERWYDVRITITGAGSHDLRITGTFENDKLDDVMESLKISAQIQYEIKKNMVFIYL